MRGLLRGVVRDHRLPGDYKAASVQPMNSSAFFNNFKRNFMVRMINKQPTNFPVTYFFFFGVPLFVIFSLHKWKVNGSLP